MRSKLFMSGFLCLAVGSATGQVASHAPTVFTPAPSVGQPSAAVSGKPVVRINGTVMTDIDLLREEYAIFPYGRQHSGIPKDLEPGVRAGAMKMMIFEELVYQEALRRKMTIPAIKLQESEAAYRKTFSSPDEFNAFLQSDFHGSRSLLDSKIRRSLLIDALLKVEVESKCGVSQAEVKALYDKSQKRFQNPESFTFQTNSVQPPPRTTLNAEQMKQQLARAELLLKKAKATKTSEDFGLLAEKESDDDYRVMMGQHKPEPRAELAPQVVKALLAMQPGAVSDLIQVGQFYTIIRLEKHSPAGMTKLEDVRAQLEKEIKEDKRNNLRRDLDAKLMQSAKIDQL